LNLWKPARPESFANTLPPDRKLQAIIEQFGFVLPVVIDWTAA